MKSEKTTMIVVLKVEEITELLDQMEDLFSDLRWEYLHMARRVDEAIERISDLEADNLDLKDALAGKEVV